MAPTWTSDCGTVKLWLGDCRDVMPSWPRDSLLAADPPYGIGRDGKPFSTSSHGGHKGYEFRGWDNATPTVEAFGLMTSFSEWMIWGANYFTQFIPPGPGWLLWDKGQRIDQADGELAATNRKSPLRVFTLNRVALMKDGAVHPTQKPLALMSWSIGLFGSDVTCDPFMGSGTTGVAAVRLGRKFYGCEIDPTYFEIAKKRIQAELNRFPLFDEVKEVQNNLIEMA